MRKLDKRLYSYSRLTCFGHCKYEFYLDYIINDDNQYLSEGNFYAEVGSYVHEILAMIFKVFHRWVTGKASITEEYKDNLYTHWETKNSSDSL